MAYRNQLCNAPTKQYVCGIAWLCSAGQRVVVRLCLGRNSGLGASLLGCLPPSELWALPYAQVGQRLLVAMQPNKKNAEAWPQHPHYSYGRQCALIRGTVEGITCLGFWKGLSFVCHAKSHDQV